MFDLRKFSPVLHIVWFIGLAYNIFQSKRKNLIFSLYRRFVSSRRWKYFDFYFLYHMIGAKTVISLPNQIGVTIWIVRGSEQIRTHIAGDENRQKYWEICGIDTGEWEVRVYITVINIGFVEEPLICWLRPSPKEGVCWLPENHYINKIVRNHYGRLSDFSKMMGGKQERKKPDWLDHFYFQTRLPNWKQGWACI